MIDINFSLKGGLRFCMFISAACLFTYCKPKQVIQKPVVKVEEKKDTVKVEVPPPAPEPKNVEMNVSFLMPFHFDENLKKADNDLDPEEIAATSLPALQFYEGAQMAADSFKNEHLKINMKVFDSADSSNLETLLKGMRIYNTDLLFSGISASYSGTLMRHAELHKTPVVNTQPGTNNGMLMMNAVPSNQTMIEEMAHYIASHCSNDKIIVVFRDEKKEKELGEWFAARIDSALLEKKVIVAKCVLVNYTQLKDDGLILKLDKSKTNLMVIASSDEAFVTPLVNLLNEKSDDYTIHVAGLPTWENFDAVNEDALEKLQAIIFSSGFINYDDNEMQNFRKAFISKYYSDPIPQAFQGFFLMKGFIKKILLDKDVWKELNNDSTSFNPSLFNFSSSSPADGYENKRITILKFEGYRLKPQSQ